MNPVRRTLQWSFYNTRLVVIKKKHHSCLNYNTLYLIPAQELSNLAAYSESSDLELLIGCDVKAPDICWENNIMKSSGNAST